MYIWFLLFFIDDSLSSPSSTLCCLNWTCRRSYYKQIVKRQEKLFPSPISFQFHLPTKKGTLWDQDLVFRSPCITITKKRHSNGMKVMYALLRHWYYYYTSTQSKLSPNQWSNFLSGYLLWHVNVNTRQNKKNKKLHVNVNHNIILLKTLCWCIMPQRWISKINSKTRKLFYNMFYVYFICSWLRLVNIFQANTCCCKHHWMSADLVPSVRS